MPPRAGGAAVGQAASQLTSSFSLSDVGNEVVCPLKNQDGSNCRKRCFGEKRYRSMQEHIRRAHPEHYISKLPATEESFFAMVNTPPSERPPQPPQEQSPQQSRNNLYGRYGLNSTINPFLNRDVTSPGASKASGELRRGSILQSANAAAALAQLHNNRADGEWESEQEPFPDADMKAQHLHNYFAAQDPNIFGGHLDPSSGKEPELNPAALLMEKLPSGRATSLQPLQRQRPRKSSVTENARKAKHERQKSKEQKRLSHDRKAYSAEPSAAAARLSGNRWEDLLEAAASATEEDSRDLTPIPQSPRLSQPPFAGMNNHISGFQSYTASPLQNTVLPQSPSDTSPTFEPPPALEPFPSVESSYETSPTDIVNPHHQSQSFHHPSHHHHQSSGGSSTSNNPYAPYNFASSRLHGASQSSGSNFHIPPEGLSSPNTAPSLSRYAANNASSNNIGTHAQHSPLQSHQQQPAPPSVQHYCAACHRSTLLNSSYACTECICGICRDCVDVLVGMGPDRGARCPRCQTVGGKFKPFLLDLR